MQTISILLVDDNPTFVRYATRFLEREETLRVVGTAENGAEAVEKARSLQPDVILLDLSMPHLGGIDALSGLGEAAPAAAVIVVTSMDPEAYRALVLERGAFAFMSKHDLTEELIPKILEAGAR